MINNPSWLLALTVALAGGCRGKTPAPDGFQGLVEYDERVVGFEVPGRIQRVSVRRGDVVAAGDPLATLDDTLELLTRDTKRRAVEAQRADLALLRAGVKKEDVASVEAEVRAASASEGLSRKSSDRSRALFASGTIAQAEVDRTDADLERALFERRSIEQRLASLRRGARVEEIARAKALVQEAEATLAYEEERLARYVLRADAAGSVVDLHVKEGELAATGTAAVTLADIAHPYVDVFVPEGELAGIQAGARATVRVDATAAPFAAVVEHVSPKTEFSPKFLFSERERPHLVIRVRVRVEDPGAALHSGVPAFARIKR